jgi:hypothetical protein
MVLAELLLATWRLQQALMIYTVPRRARWVRTLNTSSQIQKCPFLGKQLLSQVYRGVLCSPSPSPRVL